MGYVVREPIMQPWVLLRETVVCVLGVLMGVRYKSKGVESGCSFVNLFNHVEETPRTFSLFRLREHTGLWKISYLLPKHTDF